MVYGGGYILSIHRLYLGENWMKKLGKDIKWEVFIISVISKWNVLGSVIEILFKFNKVIYAAKFP